MEPDAFQAPLNQEGTTPLFSDIYNLQGFSMKRLNFTFGGYQVTGHTPDWVRSTFNKPKAEPAVAASGTPEPEIKAAPVNGSRHFLFVKFRRLANVQGPVAEKRPEFSKTIEKIEKKEEIEKVTLASNVKDPKTEGITVSSSPVSSNLAESSSKASGRPPKASDYSEQLKRFATAQTGVYGTVCKELTAGQKKTHWMWYMFPQLKGLGKSGTADTYGITGLEEAQAYLADPALRERLETCCKLVLRHKNKTIRQIFGDTDAMKFKSSMTLFSLATIEKDDIFSQCLKKKCGGKPCELTLKLLAS